jgi:hypothetical protein
MQRGVIRTRLYQKESDLKILLHFQSANAFIIKQNVLVNQLKRIYRLTSDYEEAGAQMRVFMHLMKSLREVRPRALRVVWRKFRVWLIAQRNTQTKQHAQTNKQVPLTLWLRNNTFVPPFRKSLNTFLESLSESDRGELGQLAIRNGADKSVGLRLFNP